MKEREKEKSTDSTWESHEMFKSKMEALMCSRDVIVMNMSLTFFTLKLLMTPVYSLFTL